MISSVHGKLIGKSPTSVEVFVHGIGLTIGVPLSTSQVLGEIDSNIQLYTYLHVREDVLQLFGFSSVREREIFQVLISVSGIGPRTALGILSGISVQDFVNAVYHHDVNLLSKAPGVGKKTAERIILELKEKLKPETGDTGMPTGVSGKIQEEAVLALIALGFKQQNAQNLVQAELQKQPELDVETLIRIILRRN